MAIRKTNLSNNQAAALKAINAVFVDKATEERGLSNWDFNADGNLSAIDVQNFQIAISLYEEYEERTKIAGKCIVPFYYGEKAGIYKLGDITDPADILKLPDELKPGDPPAQLRGKLYHKDMLLPLANAFSDIKKKNGQIFKFSDLYSSSKQDIVDFLNDVKSKKPASINFAEQKTYKDSNGNTTVSRASSKVISSNYGDSPFTKYALVVRGGAKDNAFRKAISQHSGPLKIDQWEYVKIIEILDQMVVKVSTTGTVLDVFFLYDPDEEYFPICKVGYSDYAADQKTGGIQNKIDPNTINDKIQALFSVLHSSNIGKAPVFSINKEYQEDFNGKVIEEYKENVLLKTSDLAEVPNNPEKIRALIKVRLYTKLLFQNSEIRDSLIRYDVNKIQILPEPYKNASYVSDGGVIHEEYSTDHHELATRFLGFQDASYFLHNIEAIHLPKIRQRVLDVIAYAIKNKTLPLGSKITDIKSIDFRSKEVADLTSAIATKHANFIVNEYGIDKNSPEGEVLVDSLEETTSLFDAPERLYSDVKVIDPPVWKIVKCKTLETYYTYENPYYDYSISGLFHAANVNDTKGVAVPKFENLFLKELTGVYYLENHTTNELGVIYEDLRKKNKGVFHLSWNAVEPLASTYFYGQKTTPQNIEEGCYTVTRGVIPLDKSLVMSYMNLPHYWHALEQDCRSKECLPPPPSPSVTPTITVTPSVTPSITVSRTPKPSVTPTRSTTPSITATPSVTPSITVSPSPTSTPLKSPSPSRSVTPTRTPSVTSTPSITVSQTPSLTPSQTPTPSKTVTPTKTVTRTSTVTPTVTTSVTKTPTVTPTVTVTTTPSQTVTPTITVSPSITVSPTVTPSITQTPSSTCSPNQTPTRTPSVTPTRTPTVTKTPSISPSITPTSTITPTITKTPSPSISVTRTCSPTRSPSLTPTRTVSPSLTPSISISPSLTPSISVSCSLTPSVTLTPTVTPSITQTPSITCSPHQSPTQTPTITPTSTPTVTKTPSMSPSVTPSASVSKTPSMSPTPTKTPSMSVTPSRTATPPPSPPPSATKVLEHCALEPVPWVFDYSCPATPTPTVTPTPTPTPSSP
jgi:hypothetical protein